MHYAGSDEVNFAKPWQNSDNKVMIVRRFSVLLLIFCCCLSGNIAYAQADSKVGLTRAEQNWLDLNPVIKVGIDRNFAPIESKAKEKGEFNGLAIDYLNLAARKLGIRFEFHSHAQWEDTIEAIKDEQLDMLGAVYETPKRQLFMDFSHPYLHLKTGIITSTHNTQNITLDDLSGQRVAVVKGYFWEEIISNDHPSIELISVPNLAAGLREAAFGTVDAFVSNLATATTYIEDQGITNLRVAGLTPYEAEFHFATRKDLTLLNSILNKALASFSEQQKADIHQRWIKLQYVDKEHLPKYFWPTAFFLFIMITGFVVGTVWNQMLRRTIKRRTEALKKELSQRLDVEVKLQKAKQELEARVDERTQSLSEAVDMLVLSQKELEEANIKLYDMANNDGLTQIANRRSLDLGLTLALANTQEKDIPLSFMLCDIDFFKLYNDHYGHQTGDICLQKVANVLENYAKRSGELAARYGGEEFALLLPGIDKQDAEKLATLILEDIRKLKLDHKASNISEHVTMSIGIVSILPAVDTKSDDIIGFADSALYEAKREGRNRWVMFDPSQEQPHSL